MNCLQGKRMTMDEYDATLNRTRRTDVGIVIIIFYSKT